MADQMVDGHPDGNAASVESVLQDVLADPSSAASRGQDLAAALGHRPFDRAGARARTTRPACGDSGPVGDAHACSDRRGPGAVAGPARSAPRPRCRHRCRICIAEGTAPRELMAPDRLPNHLAIESADRLRSISPAHSTRVAEYGGHWARPGPEDRGLRYGRVRWATTSPDGIRPTCVVAGGSGAAPVR